MHPQVIANSALRRASGKCNKRNAQQFSENATTLDSNELWCQVELFDAAVRHTAAGLANQRPWPLNVVTESTTRSSITTCRKGDASCRSPVSVEQQSQPHCYSPAAPPWILFRVLNLHCAQRCSDYRMSMLAGCPGPMTRKLFHQY